MNITVLQLDIIAGNPEANQEKAAVWFAENVKLDTDVVVLPEMWTTAYTLDALEGIAEAVDGESVVFLQKLALSYGVNIIGGSIAIKEDSLIYNRAVVIDRKGNLIYHYDKIHLVPMLNEPAYLEGGRSKVQTFELDGVKMGVVICFDLRFPEIIRQLALQEAQVLFIPAEWPEARAGHWETLSTARAIENQMYVVTCNRVGTYDGVQFAGRSMFIDPWGTVLAKGSASNEEVITRQLDLESVKTVRENVPIFTSRVPALY